MLYGFQDQFLVSDDMYAEVLQVVAPQHEQFGPVQPACAQTRHVLCYRRSEPCTTKQHCTYNTIYNTTKHQLVFVNHHHQHHSIFNEPDSQSDTWSGVHSATLRPAMTTSSAHFSRGANVYYFVILPKTQNESAVAKTIDAITDAMNFVCLSLSLIDC